MTHYTQAEYRDEGYQTLEVGDTYEIPNPYDDDDVVIHAGHTATVTKIKDKKIWVSCSCGESWWWVNYPFDWD